MLIPLSFRFAEYIQLIQSSKRSKNVVPIQIEGFYLISFIEEKYLEILDY